MARPRDELAARVEELLDAAGHRVERAPEVGELARRLDRCSRLQLTPGERLGGGLEPADAACDSGADDEGCAERGRSGRRGDGEDLHVVVHVEHHEAAEDHRRERQCDREQREPGELQPDGREQPKRRREDNPGRERAERDRDREPDHGVNR